MIPPMEWCGVLHPHSTHAWDAPMGITGVAKSCPGSLGRKLVGACCDQPFEATEVWPLPPHCILAHGHPGAHEDDDGAMWFKRDVDNTTGSPA